MKLTDIFSKKKKEPAPSNLSLLQIGDSPPLRAWLGALLPLVKERKSIEVAVTWVATQPDLHQPSVAKMAEQGFFTLLKRGVRQGQVLVEHLQARVFQHYLDAASDREGFFQTAASVSLDCVLVGWPNQNQLLLLSWFMARYQQHGQYAVKKIHCLAVFTQSLPAVSFKEQFLAMATQMRAPEKFNHWAEEHINFVDVLLLHQAVPIDTSKEQLISVSMGYQDPCCLLTEHGYLLIMASQEPIAIPFPPTDLQYPIFRLDSFEELRHAESLYVQIDGFLQAICCIQGLVEGYTYLHESLQSSKLRGVLTDVVEQELLPFQEEDEALATHFYNYHFDRALSPFHPRKLEDIAKKLPEYLQMYLGPFLAAYHEKNELLPPNTISLLSVLLKNSMANKSRCIPFNYRQEANADLKAAVDAFVAFSDYWGGSIAALGGLRAAILDRCIAR